MPAEVGRYIGLTIASLERENPDEHTSPGEAVDGIAETVKFVWVNGRETLAALGEMTWPQVCELADAIKDYAITPMGMGLSGSSGGGGTSPAPRPDREHTVEEAAAFAAMFSGVGG